MESRTIDPMKIEADAILPTEYGEFRIKVMVDKNGNEHSIPVSYTHLTLPTTPYV